MKVVFVVPFSRIFTVPLLIVLMMHAPPGAATLVEDLKSPVTTDARWILIGGTGLTLLTLATHYDVEDPFEKSTVDHTPLGKSSKTGDVMGKLVPNAAYVGGMWIASRYGAKESYEYATVMLEATAYAALITTGLKYSIREPRPYDSSVRNGFPSGHATTAFAFAGVVAAEHGWWYGAPAVLLATFVSYSRINDNQHHVHDVLGGATIGLTCAYGIFYSHKAARDGKDSAQLRIVPVPLDGGAEVMAQWKF